MSRIWLRRAYDPPTRNDGYRILIDRIWPRGVAKEDCALDEWRRDLAPSTPLRKWFGHDPARWEAFQQRYFRELERKPDAVRQLRERIARGRVTLVYGAHDREHNNAVALRTFLRKSSDRVGRRRQRAASNDTKRR